MSKYGKVNFYILFYEASWKTFSWLVIARLIFYSPSSSLGSTYMHFVCISWVEETVCSRSGLNLNKTFEEEGVVRWGVGHKFGQHSGASFSI